MRKLVSSFLDTLEKDNTKKNYKVALEQFVTYLEETLDTKDTDIDVKELKTSDVKKYRIYLTNLKDSNGKTIHYAKSTINQKIFAIESFFNFLKDDRLVDYNIVKGIKAYKADAEFNVFLNKEETAMLINYVTNMRKKNNERKFEFRKARDTFMLRLMINTGLRISEVLSIDLDNIKDDGEIYIGVTKNGRPHTVYLNQNTMDYYEKYLIEREKIKNVTTDKVFISTRGKAMEQSKSMVNRELTQYCIDAGIKRISPHKLRHSFAYLFLQNGGDIASLQEQLNHSSIGITGRYTHTTNTDRKKYSNVF